MKKFEPHIGYFSAEIGVSPSIPSYSGGLGVLAGDHVKAAADAGLPLVGVTLLYREGYMNQHVDAQGKQSEEYPPFNPSWLLEKLDKKVSFRINSHSIHLELWQYWVEGAGGYKVPILFLDSDLPENAPEYRRLCYRLYAGDNQHRLYQEMAMGLGGMAALKVLGYQKFIQVYHMNEGHTAFLTLDLLKAAGGDVEKVRKQCVFTTHTPVPAGHDEFTYETALPALGDFAPENIREFADNHGKLSMTHLALNMSRSVNAVSQLHGEVARKMYPQYQVAYVTNGVHHLSWTSRETQHLFDKQLPGWVQEPEELLKIDQVADEVLWDAHLENKINLLDYSNAMTQKGLSPNLLTIGFARRAATYKRANLLFYDLERLTEVCEGKVQFIFSGKAHPRDEHGKDVIQELYRHIRELNGRVNVVFLENYNMWLGRLITSGVDVWLNTPLRPNEASGTSGMKAALNGVPSLSVLDGWWNEGCRDGENGWAFGEPVVPSDRSDANALYRVLEEQVIPTFYNDQKAWLQIMRESIKTGVNFTAKRMLDDYISTIYALDKS
ncbi:MAG: alpha-glucan family phosphorylase [Candidatus Marinimicrobia bacterium]|nr:alpha-glucan family phosphorylase [Candidatus Neomarinimicrobiota bacterium]MCF7840336.1 alpha-glucan family phosphorylase [Candidatus Neomarinimicrobiota bacterium]